MSPPPGFQPYNSGGGGSFEPPRSLGKATAAMVCGIVGLVLCPFVLSTLALIFGITSKKEIDRSNGRYTNRGMAVAGIVLGIIGLAFIPVWFAILNSRN